MRFTMLSYCADTKPLVCVQAVLRCPQSLGAKLRSLEMLTAAVAARGLKTVPYTEITQFPRAYLMVRIGMLTLAILD